MRQAMILERIFKRNSIIIAKLPKQKDPISDIKRTKTKEKVKKKGVDMLLDDVMT